jgi:MFS family permease
MDNEHTQKSLIVELMRNFATIFTLSSLAISFAGFLAVHVTPDEQFLSELIPQIIIGSFYKTVLQIAGFSFIIAALCALFISDRFIVKMWFWLRFLLVFLFASFTVAIFAVIFKWFPLDNPLVWLGFILGTIVCSAFSLGITLIRFKLEGKKYDRLLANYKARRNNAV